MRLSQIKNISELIKIAKVITIEEAQAFINLFNNTQDKMHLQLIGSIPMLGYSTKDIDVLLHIDDDDWFESHEDLEESVYHPYMEAIGAKFKAYTYEQETEEWEWNGFLVDVHFE